MCIVRQPLFVQMNDWKVTRFIVQNWFGREALLILLRILDDTRCQPIALGVDVHLRIDATEADSKKWLNNVKMSGCMHE